MTVATNRSLKDDIRDYWSERSKTFDLAFGHRIPRGGPEFEAWSAAIADRIGRAPQRVLELACGTGEVTALLLALGHEVTALDFSEDMLAVARAKHAGRPRLRLLLADAENPMLPEASFDAIVCRHLVWTLTDPAAALVEWRRLLRPGGRLVVFDGDWSSPFGLGRVAALAIAGLDRLFGPDRHYDGALGDRHRGIMGRLPFADGLTTERLVPMLAAAGFSDIAIGSHAPIAAAQRRGANLRNRLRTFVYRRFVLSCRVEGPSAARSP